MIRIEAPDLPVILRWLNAVEPAGRDAIGRTGEQAKATLTVKARELAEEEDAIGATHDYIEGIEVELAGRGTDVVTGVLDSEALHGYYVEFGRNPGKFPPKAEIEAWMEAKGIPLELSFVIRRSIARLGTIRRAGAQGQAAGLRIFERAVETSTEEIEAFLNREIERVMVGRAV